jgi:hypothetical protein
LPPWGVFVFFLIGVAFHAAVFQQLRTAATYTPESGRFALVALGLNAVAALFALVFAFMRQQRLSAGSGRAWFFALAAGSTLAVVLLFELMDRLRLFAIRGW